MPSSKSDRHLQISIDFDNSNFNDYSHLTTLLHTTVIMGGVSVRDVPVSPIELLSLFSIRSNTDTCDRRTSSSQPTPISSSDKVVYQSQVRTTHTQLFESRNWGIFAYHFRFLS